MYPPFSPAFQLGALNVHWYGVMLVVAIIVGTVVASRYVAQRGQDREQVWNLALWMIVPAVIGARLYTLLFQLPPDANGSGYYLTHPLAILAIWQGGLHIYGALLGGGIALLTYLSVKKLPPALYLDATALALLSGQIIGRLGSFFEQTWYGPPTDVPWGVRIDPAYRVEPYNNLALYPPGQHFQPLFLYEIIWNALGLLLLWLLSRYGRKVRPGDLALLYLIWYPAGRFVLEFSRTDVNFFPGTHLDSVHLVSLIVIIASLTWLLKRHRWLARLLATPLLLGMKPAPARVAYQYVAAEEEASAEGLDIFEEYTFQRASRRSEEEDTEEYEGMEDLEEWSGQHLSIDDLYDEGEEHVHERRFLGLRWSVRSQDEEEEQEEAEEEEQNVDEEEEEANEEASDDGTLEEEEAEVTGEEEEPADEAEPDSEEESQEEVADEGESESGDEAGSYENEEGEAYTEVAWGEAESGESDPSGESLEGAEDEAEDSSDYGDGNDGGDDSDDGDCGDSGDGGDE